MTTKKEYKSPRMNEYETMTLGMIMVSGYNQNKYVPGNTEGYTVNSSWIGSFKTGVMK